MNDHEATINDVLEAVNTLSSHNDQQFAEIHAEISGMKTDISGLKQDVTSMKAVMVTKDYLDDKMSDLRGDLVVMTRKEDQKLKATLDLLVEKRVISGEEAKRIQAMEPFPQLAL